jgi:hypothetical protein
MAGAKIATTARTRRKASPNIASLLRRNCRQALDHRLREGRAAPSSPARVTAGASCARVKVA